MESAVNKVITIPAKPELALSSSAQRQLRVAAYCRVSTDDEEQLTSYEAQKKYYTEKIMTNKNWTLAGIFADEGITGTSARKRPEFLHMIRLCRQGKIDVVLTKSISRFARNTVDCLNYIRALKALNVAIIFEKENINTLESDSEILITMLGAFAQAESESISANVRWGLRQAMREGRVRFQYANFYGYERGEDNTPKIVPEQAKVVQRIFNSYLAGESVPAIKASLEADGTPSASGKAVWSTSAIQGMLRNEKYAGDVLMQKTFISDCISHKVVKNTGQLPQYLIQNHHDAIIDHKTFNAVQAEIARRTGTKAASQKRSTTGLTTYKSTYALSDRLFCGECGTQYRRVTWARNGKKRITWRCISRLDYGTQYCKNSPTIDEIPLQNAILAAINSTMSSQDVLISQISDAMRLELSPVANGQLSVGDIDREIEALSKETQALIDCALSAGGISEYATRFKAIVDETCELKRQREALILLQEQNCETGKSIAAATEIMENASPYLTEWDDVIIRQLVSSVKVISADMVEVSLKNGSIVSEEIP